MPNFYNGIIVQTDKNADSKVVKDFNQIGNRQKFLTYIPNQDKNRVEFLDYQSLEKQHELILDYQSHYVGIPGI